MQENTSYQQAQGWEVTQDGKVILTAQGNVATLNSGGIEHPGCQGNGDDEQQRKTRFRIAVVVAIAIFQTLPLSTKVKKDLIKKTNCEIYLRILWF
ncbi:MAG: hypothetical protein WA865_11250 [Spirulinaceae cyanobacterium]